MVRVIRCNEGAFVVVKVYGEERCRPRFQKVLGQQVQDAAAENTTKPGTA